MKGDNFLNSNLTIQKFSKMMMFDLPSYQLLTLLQDWISVKENCVFNSAVCNKAYRKKVLLKLMKISIKLTALPVKLSTKACCALTIESRLLKTKVKKVVIYCEKNCAKLQFEIFERFHNLQKLNGITCMNSSTSVSQFVVDTNVIKDMYLMWDANPSKSDHIVQSDEYGSFYESGNSIASKQKDFTGFSCFYDADSMISFSGHVVKGKAHGFGKTRYDDWLHWQIETHEGNHENGAQSGFGTATFKHGHVYSGQWLDDEQSGYGVMKYGHGDVYSGEWKHDQKHGKGEYITEKGEKYVGEWRKDHKHGAGELTKIDGTVLRGVWKNGKMGVEEK